MSDVPSLKNLFPDDKQLWRVDWFGQVLRNSVRESEPDIQVLISPFVGRRDKPASIKATDYSKQRIILIPVGLLPCVRIGTVWKRGEQEPPESFRYGDEIFENLQIVPETTRIVRTDHSEKDVPIIHPDYYYIRWELAGASRCLAVDFSDKKNCIIIPTVELVRFYYMQSTETARVMFNGEFAQNRNNLYDVEGSFFNEDKKTYKLKLNERFSSQDAWLAARIATSDIARRNALKIHDSIVRNKVNTGLCYPEAYPPFDGLTNLTVHGKWVRSGHVWRFLVFWIDSCTASFPFEELELQWNESGKKRITYDLEPEDGPGTEGQGKRGVKSEDQVEIDAEPASDIKGVKVLLHLSRFPYLNNKKLSRPPRVKAQEHEHRRKRVSPSKEEEDDGKGLSTGSGLRNEHGTKKLSIKIENVPIIVIKDEDLSDIFKKFITGLQVLKAELKDQFNFSLVALSEPVLKCSFGPISFFPVVYPNKASRNKIFWSYLDYKKKERRKVIVAKVMYSGRIYYLFEMERRKIQVKKKSSSAKTSNHNKKEQHATLLLHSVDHGSLSNDELKGVLLLCALNQGVWLYENELTALNRVKIIHNWTSPEDFARKIIALPRNIVC
ncbi:MAG TPA: hypothetical protein VEF33_12930 [Syntrophales bacterium]|nr:hypothetical protein [Syntrophales bacterium]